MIKGLTTVFTEPKRAFELEILPVPEIEDSGILVKNTAAVICGSDLHVWRGDDDIPPPNKYIMGHEFTGVVHSMGKKVSKDSYGRPLKEGDRIVFPFFNPCHRCYQCIRGEHHACPNRTRRSMVGVEKYPYCDGGMAEYYYLPNGHYVFKAPDDLPDIALPSVNCALSQVVFGLKRANFSFGDSVVIQGAGGLGIFATAVASNSGASQVIVIDSQKSRLDLALKCGATSVISFSDYPDQIDRIEKVKELTYRQGADMVVEVAGVPAATYEGLDMVRINGTYLDIGNISGGSLNLPANKIISNQTKWIGVMHYDPWVIEASLQFLSRTKNKFPLIDILSDEFPLEKINDAFEFAEWQGKEKGSDAKRVVLKC
tara:strand:+ start:23421 stop:24533 length:1113 start_codon:yes stop_codon:yes gene_type:complete